MRTAIICKSLFGKAHTVMAEGGIAAAWATSTATTAGRCTSATRCAAASSSTRGGWPSCTPRRPPTGCGSSRPTAPCSTAPPTARISQRNFGGHEYPRLAHVGDRTGLELIRTLQQKIVSLQQDDERESGDPESRLRSSPRCTITDLLRTRTAPSPAPSATGASPAGSSLFNAPAVVLATGGIGKSFKVTSNSWEYTGDGHALALRAGLDPRQHGVHPVPPDGHGLAAVGQGHPRHRVGARRRRRAARTPRASASCSTTCPTSSAGSTPRPRRRATAGTPTPTTTSGRRSCSPATRSRAPSTPRSRPAAGHRTAASSSTSPRGARAEEILKKLPSMHHQFKELADVDITKEPMEVGPTCHYVMGGVEVDPDTRGRGPGAGPLRGR